MDWDNKYTDEGRIEVIASRIPAEKPIEIIEIADALWNINVDDDPAAETPSFAFVVGGIALAGDADKIVAAIESDSIRWVDVFFTDANGNERQFWFDGSARNIRHDLEEGVLYTVGTIQPGSLGGPATNILTFEGISSWDDETLIRLGDLPPEESGKLRLEIGIDNNLVEDHEDSDDSENSEAIAQ